MHWSRIRLKGGVFVFTVSGGLWACCGCLWLYKPTSHTSIPCRCQYWKTAWECPLWVIQHNTWHRGLPSKQDAVGTGAMAHLSHFYSLSKQI